MDSQDKRFKELTELSNYIWENCYSAGRLLHKLEISSNSWYRKIEGKSLFREREKKALQDVFKCSDEMIDSLIPETWESYWAANGKRGGK